MAQIRFSRRDFILYSSAAIGLGAAGLYLPRLFQPKAIPSHGTIIGGGRGRQGDKDIKYLALLDLAQVHPQPYFLALDFQPHGISRHPLHPHLITVFEKKGPGACEIDLSIKQRTRTITTVPGRHFYGHGVYSKDGSKLYATETVLATHEGVIAIRDAKNLELEGLFPTHGANPHECHLIEDGTVIAVTNGGGPHGSGLRPSVTYVDLATQKLINKYEMRDDRFNTGHLQISKGKELVVVSAPREGLSEDGLGAISFLSAEGALETLTQPSPIIAKLKAETLSLCIDEVRGVFAATSPRGNMVSFWNLKTKKFISSLNLINPRGIVLTENKNFYAISHGADAGVTFVNADTFSAEAGSHIAKAGFSGSHLYLV